MLQEIAPHRFDNAYGIRRPARKGDQILCYSKDEVLVRERAGAASGYEFPAFEEVYGEDAKTAEELYYLFAIDDTAYFLIWEEDLPEKAREAFSFQPVQIFRAMAEGDTVPLALMTGLHLYNWRRKNRFCGGCGHPTKLHQTERALFCPECRNLIFPQIAPAVAVAVIDGDRILLAKSAGGGFRRFALIAGYVEIGETIEETIHREVMEEVGLEVKNLQYFKSQPWGLTGIEMMGFFVELSGSDRIAIQESELAEARWFRAEEVDRDMALHSLSYTMIDEFCRRHGI